MPWPTKKLGEIARIFSGSSAPQDEKYFKNGKYPFVRVFDLATPRSGVELVETRDSVNDLAITELNLVEAKKGSIVFPKSGASILNNNRAMLGTNAYIVSHLSVIELDEDLAVRNWVYYFLSKFDMGKLVSDPGYPSLNISAIEKIKIPLPPLPIQKQIVERLDKIVGAQKLNDDLIKKTDELFQSLLRKELNPADQDWEVKKLGNIIKPQYGYTTSAKDSGSYRFIRITDIGDEGELRDYDKKYVTLSQNEAENYQLQNGDLLLARTGATFGKILHFEKTEPAIFASFLIRLNPNASIDPFYIWLFSRSQNYWRQARTLMTGSGQPQFNANKLKQIKIPVPPIKRQKQIVTKLSAVQNYKKQLIEQKAKLKELFDSALAKSLSNKN